MAITPVSFTRFSRHGDNLGRLHVLAAKHTDALDGTDKLELTCTEDLTKNEYVVWRDRQGTWHEHIVDSFKRTHDFTGAPLTVATCINSIAETWDDYVEDKRPSGEARVALTSILATSRWEPGICTQQGSASHTFYHISVREAIQELLQVWGGELETVIEVDASGVTRREARIRATRGNQYSAKRFTWTKDLITISRDVASDNPKTRLYAYGKGEQTEAGGYGRRIGIESVNDGLPYVEDAEATAIWGHPMPDGTTKPSDGVFIDDQCTDPSVLLAEVRAALEVSKVPVVSYTAEVLDLVSFGREWEDVGVGDQVAIIDHEFSEEGLRLRGRVSKVERDLLTYDTTVTFGTLVDAIANPWQSLQSKLSSLSRRSANWDMAGEASTEWLETMMQGLNVAFNLAGTYRFSSFEVGDIWSSVPLDENGRATRSGGWAINLNGMGFRIASGLNPDGSWNWRTFGTGEGFTSDAITTGTLKAGRIQDVAQSGNYWDLDTGEFRIASTARLGTKTVQDVLDDVDDTITDVDMEYASGTSATQAPTTGWSTTAPPWEAGKYIWSRTKTTTAAGVNYSTPVMISGRDGTDGTSVTIKGHYDTYQQLIAAHPTGSDGDAYMVGADLYVWNGSNWENVGQIQGPQGPAGTSVTVSSIQYGTSSSASTQPSSWSTTAPTSITKGKWLWIRTNYSNGSTATTKSYVGTDGSRGADGTSYHVHIAWANSADGSQDFSTTDPSGKSYLGVYTDSNESGSTTPSAYKWSKIEGESGSDGIGITSIIEEYYLSTSSTRQSGGSWQTTPQAYVSGKFYWTRSAITWTDGTTTRTDPVLARGLNSANSNATQAQSDVDAISTQEAIFNLLTNDGALQGLYMQDGDLYLNGSYIMTGYIGSTSSDAYWDLDNGEMAIITEGYHSDGHVGLIKVQAGETTVSDPTGFLFNTTSDVLIKGLHVWNDATYTYDQNYVHHVYLAPAYGSGLNHPVLLADDPLLIAGALSDTSTASTPRPSQLRLGLGNIQLMTSDYDGGRLGMLFTNRNAYFYANGVLWGHYSSNSSGSTKRLDLSCNLSVSGTKNRIVSTDNYGDRLLYCDETPSPMFTDVGSGVIGNDFLCYVEIDDAFSETARTDLTYQVFLQACGRGELWVEEKHPNYFVVKGSRGLAFDWQLKARQKGYESLRLEDDGLSTAVEDDPYDLISTDAYSYELSYIRQIEAIYSDDLVA